MNIVRCLFLTASLATCAHAAVLEQDLGQSLTYLRVSDLAADLPAVEKSLHDKPSLILDLRAVSADVDKAAALRQVLDKNSGPHQIRFVLLSSTTPPPVIAAVSTEHAGVITFGARTPALTPDIAVPISSDDDRLAYDAMAGTPLDKLLNSTVEKRRFDESALLRERAAGANSGDTGPDDDASALSPEATDLHATTAETHPAKKPEPAPLIDAVLQRAVQLHRALLALKKL